MVLTVVPLASLPAPGQPPDAIDALAAGGNPARMTKRSGYNALEFGFAGTGSGDYALFSYWPDSKSWKPEGPRGATPAKIDLATVADSVPVRISTAVTECEVCVVLCAGAGVAGGVVELREQMR
jgi:hypothetical protein